MTTLDVRELSEVHLQKTLPFNDQRSCGSARETHKEGRGEQREEAAIINLAASSGETREQKETEKRRTNSGGGHASFFERRKTRIFRHFFGCNNSSSPEEGTYATFLLSWCREKETQRFPKTLFIHCWRPSGSAKHATLARRNRWVARACQHCPLSSFAVRVCSCGAHLWWCPFVVFMEERRKRASGSQAESYVCADSRIVRGQVVRFFCFVFFSINICASSYVIGLYTANRRRAIFLFFFSNSSRIPL